MIELFRMRRSKISRLSHEARENLNKRLEDGEPGKRLLAWLNDLAETKSVVAREFGGKPISESNLSDWRLGGYEEWRARKETLAAAVEFAMKAGEGVGTAAAVTQWVSEAMSVELAGMTRALVAREEFSKRKWERLRALGELADAMRDEELRVAESRLRALESGLIKGNRA